MFYFDILPCSPPPPSKVPHKPTLNAMCSIGMKTNKWRTDGRSSLTISNLHTQLVGLYGRLFGSFALFYAEGNRKGNGCSFANGSSLHFNRYMLQVNRKATFTASTLIAC